MREKERGTGLESHLVSFSFSIWLGNFTSWERDWKEREVEVVVKEESAKWRLQWIGGGGCVVFASSFRLLLLISMLTLLLDHFKSFATFFIIYHFIEREKERNQS